LQILQNRGSAERLVYKKAWFAGTILNPTKGVKFSNLEWVFT